LNNLTQQLCFEDPNHGGNIMRKLALVLLSFFIMLTFASTIYAAKWTFLVYLNAKNNLYRDGIANMLSMEKVGSNDEVNIVVEWGDYNAKKTVRMLIKKSNDPAHIISPVIQDLGIIDMGNYKTLENFIAWGVQNYPADHYFVDVWDHGSGWHTSLSQSAQTDNTNALSDISWDDLSRTHISTEQLATAINYAAGVMGHKVDIYGSDACLMGMAEIADQMGKAVSVYVGSQENEPSLGWPYENFLTHLEANANATAAQVATTLVNDYLAYYKNFTPKPSVPFEVTLSAYDLSKLTLFNYAVAGLANAVRNLPKNSVAPYFDALKKVQRFDTRDYVDLAHLVKKLVAAKVVGIDPRFATLIEKAVDDLVIANGVTTKYVNAHGVSIWMPADTHVYNNFIARYRALRFQYDTNWGEALVSLFT
jgi:hypothetical protein